MTTPSPVGHPNLVAAIIDEIQASGPITFARFMELALYHPEFGYYTRTSDEAPTEVGTPEIGEERIGWSGDYYTSSDLHPALAQAVAKQARQIDDLLGRPDPFTVVEMGPGKGLFARDFLADCARHPEFFGRLRYVLIERSPAMQVALRRNLASWLVDKSRVTWMRGLEEFASGSVVGLLLSNELLDAFPVHRIRVCAGEPKEIYVTVKDGRFVEMLGELSSPELSQYWHRLIQMELAFPDGYTTEMNLEALRWVKEVARVLGRGVTITIDYGHTAQDLYRPDRTRGTLLCYYHQTASEDPYSRVGLQDMTAHVDFTSLAAAGEEVGLHVTGFTNQMSFLVSWGVEELLRSLEPGSPEFQSVIQLLRPEGMGRTFKILIQHKGMNHPQLDGLRYKPFFGSALAAVGGCHG